MERSFGKYDSRSSNHNFPFNLIGKKFQMKTNVDFLSSRKFKFIFCISILIRFHILAHSNFNLYSLLITVLDLLFSFLAINYTDTFIVWRENICCLVVFAYQYLGGKNCPVYILIFYYIFTHYFVVKRMVTQFYIKLMLVGLFSSFYLGEYHFGECMSIFYLFVVTFTSITIVEDIVRSNENLICETKISKAKASIFYEGSHELRNPLQALLYSISYLKSLTFEEKIMEVIDDMKTTSSLLCLIMETVLDYSRIMEKNFVLSKRKVVMRTILDDIAIVYSNQALEKGLDLITFVDPNIPLNTIGDPTRISQIISNFTSNAIKYTKRGKILIMAELVSSSSLKCEIKISTEDQGIGIEKSDIENLFTPYQQLKEKGEKGWYFTSFLH